MRGLKLLGVTGVFLASVAGAQTDSRSQDVLAAVHNAPGGERISADARYRVAFSDLNDDHQPEAIVYLTDRNPCGSGGCTTFVLTHADGAWHPIGRMTVSQLPIYRLPTHHNGWFDLAVRAGGGGIRPGMRTMSFSRGHYAGNPTKAPVLVEVPQEATLVLGVDSAELPTGQ